MPRRVLSPVCVPAVSAAWRAPGACPHCAARVDGSGGGWRAAEAGVAANRGQQGVRHRAGRRRSSHQPALLLRWLGYGGWRLKRAEAEADSFVRCPHRLACLCSRQYICPRAAPACRCRHSRCAAHFRKLHGAGAGGQALPLAALGPCHAVALPALSGLQRLSRPPTHARKRAFKWAISTPALTLPQHVFMEEISGMASPANFQHSTAWAQVGV